MTELSLRERFARRVPTRAIDLVSSGSPEVVSIERGDWAGLKTISAIFALRRRGVPMLDAKRSIEAAMEQGRVVVDVPTVESVEILGEELRAAGFTPTFLTSAMRERLAVASE
jgi:hypothetical protein